MSANCFSSGDFVSQTAYRGFAPKPHWETSVPQTTWAIAPTQMKTLGSASDGKSVKCRRTDYCSGNVRDGLF